MSGSLRRGVNGLLVIKNFVFGDNYFTRGEFVLYINHSGKYIEINFNMKIPFLVSAAFKSFFQDS